MIVLDERIDVPSDFPYMTSAKNLKPIMERIKGAGTPPKFTLEFLRSLGYTSSSDRPVIGVLKGLGFLTPDGVPTDRYNAFRDSARSGGAMASGLRDGWSTVFLADQAANTRTSTQLTELFKSVSGKGEAVAKKMGTTFKALCELADWTAGVTDPPPATTQLDPVAVTPDPEAPRNAVLSTAGLALHHDVHVHLPATSDVSVYTAIFRALKAELLD